MTEKATACPTCGGSAKLGRRGIWKATVTVKELRAMTDDEAIRYGEKIVRQFIALSGKLARWNAWKATQTKESPVAPMSHNRAETGKE